MWSDRATPLPHTHTHTHTPAHPPPCPQSQHLAGSPWLYTRPVLGARPYWSANLKPLALPLESHRARGESEGCGWVSDVGWRSVGWDSRGEQLGEWKESWIKTGLRHWPCSRCVPSGSQLLHVIPPLMKIKPKCPQKRAGQMDYDVSPVTWSVCVSFKGIGGICQSLCIDYFACFTFFLYSASKGMSPPPSLFPPVPLTPSPSLPPSLPLLGSVSVAISFVNSISLSLAFFLFSLSPPTFVSGAD